MVAVTRGNVYKALVQFTLLVIAIALMGESTTIPHTTSELATTTPPPPVTTTTPFTTPPGCFKDGKWYRPGEEMSRGFDGKNWCYGTYCDRNGQVIAWDNWTCGTTTIPTTNIPTPTPPLPTRRRGCFKDGKWYRPGEEMSRGFDGKNWCYGTNCDRYGQVVTWDNFNCGPTTVSTTHTPTTTPTTHEPTTTPTTHAPTAIPRKTNKIPHRGRGCYYRGNRYEPNSNILQSTNGNGWCYGKRCSDDNQVILWDDFTCQPRKSGGCWYAGYRYAYGSELFRVRNQFLCYGGVCGKNGKIKSWTRMSCRKEMQFYGGRLKPSWCKYRGKLYPRGSVFAVKSLSKRYGFGWCMGAKCAENGRIVTWGPKWAPGYC